MLANSQIDGLDMLGRMAEAASSRAVMQFGRPLQLTGCVLFELRPGLQSADLTMECWPVRTDGPFVISVFASSRLPDGRDGMAGCGRFTFSTLPDRKAFPE